jgi:hypothetical protein
MSDIFDLDAGDWSYTAIVPEVLRTSQLPLPARTVSNSLPLTARVLKFARPRGTARSWQKRMGHQNFGDVDDLDEEYNRELWEGLMGRRRYPAARSGQDLRQNRQRF